MLAFAQGGGPIVVDPSGAPSSGAPRPAGIWIINADGSGLRQLTTNDDDFPAWSPDGETIALTRENHIVTVDATSGANAC